MELAAERLDAEKPEAEQGNRCAAIGNRSRGAREGRCFRRGFQGIDRLARDELGRQSVVTVALAQSYKLLQINIAAEILHIAHVQIPTHIHDVTNPFLRDIQPRERCGEVITQTVMDDKRASPCNRGSIATNRANGVGAGNLPKKGIGRSRSS